MMKPQQKNILKSDFFLFSYGYWKCTFVNPLIEDTCTLNRLHLSLSVLSHGDYIISHLSNTKLDPPPYRFVAGSSQMT